MDGPTKEEAVKAFQNLLDEPDFKIAGALCAMTVVEQSAKLHKKVAVIIMMNTVTALIDSILAGEHGEMVSSCKEIFKTRILETLVPRDKRIPKEI